jgi:AcrR family transcriptional regulator
VTVTPDASSSNFSRSRLPRPARRTQLLGAAREVFVAHGYHAAAMDDIAECAGVSKPVLYQHFPGKLDLYLALLDQHGDELVAAVRAALASTTDNKQRVAATIAAYFAFVDGDDGAFRLVFESDLTNDSAVRDRVERVTVECAEAISDVIRQDTGFSDEQAHLVAVGLTGMAEVGARYWLARRGTISREEAAQLIGALSWRGISGFPRTGGDEGRADPPQGRAD